MGMTNCKDEQYPRCYKDNTESASSMEPVGESNTELIDPDDPPNSRTQPEAETKKDSKSSLQDNTATQWKWGKYSTFAIYRYKKSTLSLNSNPGISSPRKSHLIKDYGPKGVIHVSQFAADDKYGPGKSGSGPCTPPRQEPQVLCS